MPAYKININKAGGTVSFNPKSLTVLAGDQISWTNNDTHPHAPGIVNNDGSFVGFQASPIPANGVSDVFSPTPQVDGNNNQIAYTISYVCDLHRTETGTILVNPTP